ncbi:DNA topoisomerase 4 subunit A [Philodulcilactobacillus myokoensis]|uniref:DNA topoisomerase 4 subunit A n=1 Tax=Philodulcilactobacillus myokoensis TaxID=2929573 RepID=A0A9W6B0Y6_9LACO|nr:DNA topoisomerase IV subunit A [Philodulcilactobacillus myokoensis]GLB46855.1 DNA topoisomerase 4 subunit A [Philodulcilactobacillus myokoensis]
MKNGQNIEKLTLETIMSERFSRYSKSIIQERALPDIRDGLKPVQRRILYAMNKDGNTFNKAFRKSAKSVGNVMGNFHPHGDSSIYEALVRMSQDWKLREPLIEMHGNNGSMDGDPAAAMRYTEARLSKIASEMLRDIDKNTVHWVLNFDDTEYEPTVLPSRFPNLLVNGATGISSGYATNIPPHNLGEVIRALIYLQKNPDASLDDLMQFIKGPDFPTGGIVQGLDGIKEAYRTGYGRIAVRSKTKIEQIRGGKQQIHVSEIPYDVNKLQLVKQIDEIRISRKIEGIAEVRDESDRNGLSIMIELKRNADADGILNYLFKNTDLQISYSFNMIAINHMRPERLPLKTFLQSYLEFQRSVVAKRTDFDLHRALDRKEIVSGLIKAMSILSQVIKVIRHSKNRRDAKDNLMKSFEFSDRQAEAIVTLQLYRLSNTDVSALKREMDDLNARINRFHQILDNHDVLDTVLRNELQKIEKEYKSPRQTKIEAKVTPLKISTDVTVPDEDVVVLVSHDGYLKRSSIRSYKASNRNENGLKPDDYPIFMKKLNTRNCLFMFTNKGHLIYRPVYEIADARWKETGEHISQTIGLDHNEEIIATYPFKSLKEASGMFLIATNDGHIKRTLVSKLKPGRNYHSHATVYQKMKANQSIVVNVLYLKPDLPKTTILLISNQGLATRYDLAQISITGARTMGVKSMNLNNGDLVADAQLVDDQDQIGIITQKGFFKKLAVKEIPITNRGTKGMLVLKKLKRDPHQINDFIKIKFDDDNQPFPLRVYTDRKRSHDILPSEYNLSARTSNGFNVLDVKKEGRPVQITNLWFK